MHTINQIEIRGFRGQSKIINIRLDRKANFIIGRNGTGKTTLINLIRAAISIDVSTLREIEFSSIHLTFRMAGSIRKPSIYIYKDSENPQNTIVYTIKMHSRDKSSHYVVYRREVRRFKTTLPGRTMIQYAENPIRESDNIGALTEKISKLYRITWLSLHRRDVVIEEDEDEDEWVHARSEKKSDVDEKLEQAFARLSSYFYRLDGEVTEKIRDFQKNWFLSSLTSRSMAGADEFSKINIDDDKLLLESIFDNFDVSRDEYRSDLEDQFRNFQVVRKNYQNKPRNIEINEMFFLLDTLKLHRLASSWQKLEEHRSEITKPKKNFTNTCMKMLFRKQILIDSFNSIIILSEKSRQIPLNNLSSGEKQLLIFLSETLLQEENTHIFLADEPELSLHVEWQEELVPNLFQINPNAQVIFATHSPDIVGKFQDHIINMEDIIDDI